MSATSMAGTVLLALPMPLPLIPVPAIPLDALDTALVPVDDDLTEEELTEAQKREEEKKRKMPSTQWTDEEDAKLATAVELHGARWSTIAEHVPGRTGKQCRERWKNQVRSFF